MILCASISGGVHVAVGGVVARSGMDQARKDSGDSDTPSFVRGARREEYVRESEA